jgi:hypothetical protein
VRIQKDIFGCQAFYGNILHPKSVVFVKRFNFRIIRILFVLGKQTKSIEYGYRIVASEIAWDGNK